MPTLPRRPLLLLLLATAACLPLPHAGALEIRVQPGGPVPSLPAARDAIRSARATGDSSPAVVLVEDGEYRFEAPLELEPRDSHIRFQAAPGAHPRLLGSRKITGWKREPNGLWSAQLPPATRLEALWVNGRRATRARTPNSGYVQAQGQPSAPIDGIPLAGPASKTLLSVTPADLEPLRSLTPDQIRTVQVKVYHSWDVSRLQLAGIDAAAGKLQFTGGVREFFHLEPWHRLEFENLPTALDAPGEWFLEPAGRLLYLPQPGEEPRDVEAPAAKQWLVLRGSPGSDQWVEDLAFEGLSFQFQSWMTPKTGIHAGQAEKDLPDPAIEAEGIRGVRFAHCEFAHTMTHAAWLRGGCSGVTFSHCHFHDLGAGGVYVGDPTVSAPGPRHTHHVTVEDCILHHGGRHFHAGIGMVLFHASDCILRNTDIGDFFYSAVSIGWTWGYKPTVAGRNLVEKCRLHHLGHAVLSDMGGVYTLGSQLGTVIRNNHIHDISCASYGGWGMYNDEGSTGVLWENNLVHDTQSAGYHQHYGRGNLVRNNILAWGREEHVRRSKPEDHFAFAFERNIVLMGQGRLLTHLDPNWLDGRVHLADNVYWHPETPPTQFAGKSWAEWQALGQDVRSIIADPGFRDPARGDWSLPPDSPAIALGFQPFNWREAGVRGSGDWRTLATTPMPPIQYADKPKPPALQLNESFDHLPLNQRTDLGRKNRNRPSLYPVRDIPGAHHACLELRDGPTEPSAFEPHFFFDPGHVSGQTTVRFRLRIEPGYQFAHEWRDATSPYHTSVFLQIAGGKLSAAGRVLTDIPDLTWVEIEIRAPVTGSTWAVLVTPEGQPTRTFENLAVRHSIEEIRWLGFISNGTAPSKAWLDDLQIANVPR